ncbi:endonuclease/exonuclease/phosphatase family protein [Jiangella sp. DSM 45060]|uniref:endonuclease/exonuclease/phosphatase family protein n=1 Tax=Jiangella sp. DSM 45060 TaxID=1798224 RepID=UPI00087ACE5D|nr:endonuclease/exonuclease/phosphatase family protein [Jiangella sp. DSM 45060]SDT72880.1 Metal-dependent hydrolase, endonuclease/exonuclease/phosphatase family [Jiangella sp. DSM 45060]
MTVIGTWNLENLFRPGDGDGRPPDRATYEAKLDALAGTVGRMAPDVLAVQEIGEQAALDDLVERLDGDWTTHVSEHPDSRGIRVAAISRLPVDETEDLVAYADGVGPVRASDGGALSEEMGRGALRVRVRTAAGGTVDIVTCHLKSKLLSYPGGRFSPRDEGERARYGAFALYRRAAEAATVREWANTLLDGDGRQRALVVCGDLNDEPGAATTQILLGPGGSEIGTPGETQPDQGDAWRLWNTAPLIAEARRYSRVYRGRGELIDHVLVSHQLLGRIEAVDSLVDRGLASVTDDPRRRAAAEDSDHAPVVATFTD